MGTIRSVRFPVSLSSIAVMVIVRAVFAALPAGKVDRQAARVFFAPSPLTLKWVS